MTLPFSDPFWEEFLPPNGWNCRCSVVQVRKSKYPVTDAAEARRRGNQALRRDSRGMFRFNPGTQQKTVPDYNPYTISACRSCPVANGKSKLAKSSIPPNQLCNACGKNHELETEHFKSESSKRRHFYLDKMSHLLNKTVEVSINGEQASVGFNKFGNKHLYSDTFGRGGCLNADDLENFDQILSQSEYVSTVNNEKDRKKLKIDRFHYFKVNLHNQEVYLNVAETVTQRESGKVDRVRFVYSVTKSILNKKTNE